MVRWLTAFFLIVFFGAGGFIFYQFTNVKEYPTLVRNYVLNIIPFKVEKEITLNFSGDHILGRSVNYLTTKSGDFTWSYKYISNELSKSDLTIINLESPLLKECPLTNEGFIFCGDYRNIAGLSLAGVDLIGMANNHAGDYGIDGVKETTKHLESSGILVSGTLDNQVAYKGVGETKFAFLAFNSIGNEPGVLPANEELIKNLLVEARGNSDFVIVQMHWGNEYTKELTSFQKNMGKFLIDNGADLVIGNHPHWIQDYEIYNGKYILYALGNFIFDQEWSKETKEGVIAKFTIKNKKVSKLEFIPIEIRNYGQVFKTNNFDIIPREIK
jgi:poly-gamma-glutamate synthesis protein (capsule biosynthesis protein)